MPFHPIPQPTLTLQHLFSPHLGTLPTASFPLLQQQFHFFPDHTTLIFISFLNIDQTFFNFPSSNLHQQRILFTATMETPKKAIKWDAEAERDLYAACLVVAGEPKGQTLSKAVELLRDTHGVSYTLKAASHRM